MSLCHLTLWRSAAAALVLAVIVVAMPTLLNAQEKTPKVEMFLGWQWSDPGGSIPNGLDQDGNPLSLRLPGTSHGAGASLAYNFTKYFALEGDYGVSLGKLGNNITASFGPKITYRSEGMNFFVHTLFGLNRLTPTALPADNSLKGTILGGGMDLKVWKAVSLRIFEADYVFSQHNFENFPGLHHGTMNGARVRTGLVFSFGGAPEVPPAAACSIDHNEVLVGEPLHLTVAPSNFNPKHTLKYDWTSTGGNIEGKETGATINTAGAAPGSYTATARVSDPKKTKGGEASCTSNFTVRPLNPPQLSCSVNPATVEIGTPSSVTCRCTSPDNVPVTVGGWTSSGGSIAGSGNSATLTTTGASAGPVTVNATCTDSRGLTASTSSSVTLNNPPPPPPVVDRQLEARLALHSVYFVTAKPTEKEPNAGLLASQQQTLVALATDFKKYLEAKPDARLTLEGHADVRGSVPYNQALSERRVVRVKSFLVENGVPEANLATKAFGNQHNLTADEVKGAVDQNPELTKEERTRVLRNMKTIIWASNRRVDITLNAAGQTPETSIRQYPFNAADSLTLIGGREVPKKAPAAAPAKKGAKKPTKKQ